LNCSAAPDRVTKITRDYLPTGFGGNGKDYEIGRFRELVREA